MNGYEIREYREADIEQLISLWRRVFGDSEGFLRCFFAALPHMGSGLVAEREGRIYGAAYTITGQQLCLTGGERKKLGYIYGVAVDEGCRGHGIGAELVKGVCALSKARGAEILCTLPAEGSLYGWYEKLMGVRCALFRQLRAVKAAEGCGCGLISAGEYKERREKLLAGKNHLCPSDALMAFQGQMAVEYGGGLYAVGDGIATAYKDRDMAIIRELLLPDGADACAAAAALCHGMGAESAMLFQAAAEGKKYIAADCPLPPDTVWNLSLD